MKIFSTNNFYQNNTYKIANNKSNNYYLTRIENVDSFEKTKNQPTFKANLKSLQKTAQKIIEDPSLREKFAGFLAAGFAAITSIALGNDAEENNNKTEAEVIADALTKISQEETHIEEQESQISEENKNKNIEGSIVADESTQSAEIPEEKVEDETADLEIFAIELPKKSGAKPKRIIELSKLNDLQIKLSEENAQKLTEICNHLLNNKGEEINTTAQKLRISLSKDQTNNDRTETIEKIYSEIFPNKENESEAKTSEEAVAKEKTTTSADTKKRRPRIGMVSSSNIKNSPVNSNPEMKIVSENKKGIVFEFKQRGTVPTNIRQNFDTIFKQFRALVNDEYNKNPEIEKPKFMSHFELEGAHENDIKNELKNHEYVNINAAINKHGSIILDEIYDALNSDIGFKAIFSLHGALRFIERFVNLDSESSIKNQCEPLIESLKEAIRVEMSNGMKVQTYYDNNKYIGAKITIKADKLNNPAGFKVGGSSDFDLTICNGWDGRYFKKPIIHTIF